MDFRFVKIISLPKLSWCARVEKGNPNVTMYHGSAVEIRPHAFVEGAWDDDFAKFNFLDGLVLCGTGGQSDESGVRFTGSTDRMCPLFSVRVSNVLYISNSMVFAIHAAGESPDPVYPYYGSDLVRIWRQGLHCLHGTFPLASGRKVGIHFNATLHVGNGGSMTLQPHRPGPAPTAYDDYLAALSERIQRVFENARASERDVSFQPIAAISRGYDSTATAILARDAGCRDFFTFKDSRQPDPRFDSGLANAKHLHMNCQEFDRWTFAERGDSITREFSMFGTFCYTPLAGLEETLRDSILVSGYFGDTIWDPVKSSICAHFTQSWANDVSCASLVEFRLRVGFLYFVPTFIMAQHNLAIHRITTASSMQPWSIGGEYNRPIARRIIEDAGLPRGEFALQKRGSGHAHFNKRSPRVAYQASDDYWSFLRELHSNVSPFRTWGWRTRVKIASTLWQTIGGRKVRLKPSTPWQRRFPFLVNRAPVSMDWDSLFTLQWSFAQLAPRYGLGKGVSPHY